MSQNVFHGTEKKHVKRMGVTNGYPPPSFGKTGSFSHYT